MANKQQNIPEHVLSMAVQTILLLERFAVLYAQNNDVERLHLVLKSGVSVNTRCRDQPHSPTLLHIAATNGCRRTALLLLELGAETCVVAGTLGTPLHQAAGCGHLSTVKAMLKAGCPVDMVASNGGSVLHAAAVGGDVEVIRELLNTGCDINVTDNDSRTPLHVAAWNGKAEAALELIKHGAEKAIVAVARGTPLHQAAFGGHESSVKAMLKAGCPVDVVDDNGFSVLHAAAEGGNAEVIREVLSTGCDINATSNHGGTPLHFAARNGKTEAILELIRHGAETAILASAKGTPLHQAAFGGHESSVKALLKAGCPVDVVDSNGFSILHAAAEGGNAEVIIEMLSSGCYIDAALTDGRTPLHMAARKGKTEAALELIRHGAETAIVAGARGTPLHQAIFSGHKSTVKAMLEVGCPVDVVNSNGFSVLHAAAQGGSAEVISDVVSTGCDINVTDNDSRTPLHVAAWNGKTEAALQLIRYGAKKAIVAVARGTPLHQAAFGGHMSTVKALLKESCPVDVVDDNGFSVLHAAAQGGSAEVIREVLSTGCDIHATGSDGRTPLHVAAGKGKTEAALELIRHGAEKAIVAGARGTPLHQAAFGGYVSTVKAMLKAGCPVDVVDSNGFSVLHAAAESSNVEVICNVLSTGCDINVADNNGGTPLHVAAREGDTEAVLELIRHGAENAIVAGVIGTPLHQAAFGGHESTVKAMVKEGCPVDVLDGNGFSVLHAAAEGGNAEVISDVLRTGSDINAADNDSRTPLHVAAGKGRIEAALELVRLGAEKAIVAGVKGTPLHQAAFHGHAFTVKALLKAGCPVDVVDGNGLSVLHAAAAGGNAKVISEVLSTGCDINAIDKDGETPLHVAAGKGKTEATLELIKHGAVKTIVAGAGGTPLHQAVLRGHVSTAKTMLKAGCPVHVVASNGGSVLHYAAQSGIAEVIEVVLSTGCYTNATASDGETPLHIMHVAAGKGNTEAALDFFGLRATKERGVNGIDVLGFTPLHYAVVSKNRDCVRVLLEYGADPRQVAPYIGSPYTCVCTIVDAPDVMEAFDDILVEGGDERLPWMHDILKDHRWSRDFHKLHLDRCSALERDTFGISRLEYVLTHEPDSEMVVCCFQKLPLVNIDNLLLLATINGIGTAVSNFASIATFCPSYPTQTVISLLKLHYFYSEQVAMPQLQELAPPETTNLNLLHVAVLAMKGMASGEALITDEFVVADHTSLLKSLVTSSSFRHTLHEYLGNLTLLDLAEKLGLDKAVTIISRAGGRHGIWTVLSEEARLQLGPTVLLAHQEVMKLISSGALGQQAAQAMFSQLPWRTTVEQGTSTEESHLLQQKVLDQRPDLAIIVKTVLPKIAYVHWKEFGIILEIPLQILNDIDRNEYLLRGKYLEVLIYWLKHNESASWRTLLEALGRFGTKQTLDQLTQEILATQHSEVRPISGTTQNLPLHLLPVEFGASPPSPSSQLSPQFVSHVVHHVGVNWYNFALHLGISSTILDVISVERQSLISDCCRESLHRWLRHDRDTGGKGREVGVLLEAVRKACGPVTVEHIQSSLQGSEFQLPSPTPLLQSTPELAVLQEIVVPCTAAQWEVVSDYLLVSYEKRAAIAASERGRVEVCCRELFNQWLQQLTGTGSLPRTWEAVLDVVGEAVGPEVAKRIRTRLDLNEGVTPTSSPLVDPLKSAFLSSKPTAVLLLRKVVPKVAHEWLQIGVFLEMEVAILKTFKTTESHDLKLCCLEMFVSWLKESAGTGESPRTWSSVLSAVGDCLGQDVADNIERALLEGRCQRK